MSSSMFVFNFRSVSLASTSAESLVHTHFMLFMQPKIKLEILKMKKVVLILEVGIGTWIESAIFCGC